MTKEMALIKLDALIKEYEAKVEGMCITEDVLSPESLRVPEHCEIMGYIRGLRTARAHLLP